MYKFKIFKLVLVPKVASVCLTCLYFLVARNNEEPWLGDWDSEFSNVLQAYLITYSRVVYMMLLISYGDTPSVSVFTYCAELVGLTVGMGFYFFMLCTYALLQTTKPFLIGLISAQILQIVNKFNSSANKYYQMILQLQEYMNYKNLPDSLKTRILEYYDFRFQRNYYKEKEILNTISEQLRHVSLYYNIDLFMQSVSICVMWVASNLFS